LELPVEFRRDEQLVAGEARGGDARAHALLVAVLRGGVDVAVAELGRLDDDRGHLVVAERPRAEADLRD
jgi:hypothetical protein